MADCETSSWAWEVPIRRSLWSLLVVLLGVSLSGPDPVRAGDPLGGGYSDDPNQVFWFIQLSDTHRNLDRYLNK